MSEDYEQEWTKHKQAIADDLYTIAEKIKTNKPFYHMGLYRGRDVYWIKPYNDRPNIVNYILHLQNQEKDNDGDIRIIFDRGYISLRTLKSLYFLNTVDIDVIILNAIKDILFSFEDRTGLEIDSDIWDWLGVNDVRKNAG